MVLPPLALRSLPGVSEHYRRDAPRRWRYVALQLVRETHGTFCGHYVGEATARPKPVSAEVGPTTPIRLGRQMRSSRVRYWTQGSRVDARGSEAHSWMRGPSISSMGRRLRSSTSPCRMHDTYLSIWHGFSGKYSFAKSRSAPFRVGRPHSRTVTVPLAGADGLTIYKSCEPRVLTPLADCRPFLPLATRKNIGRNLELPVWSEHDVEVHAHERRLVRFGVGRLLGLLGRHQGS